MPFRWRPIESEDISACANVIAAHPVIGPRYGPAIDYLDLAWRRLLGSMAMTTAVFEEVTQSGVAFAGVGVGVFVRDEFVVELKTAPQFWFGPELCRCIVGGNSPVLSDREVLEANSGDGLNELVWESLPSPAFVNRSEMFHLMPRAYIEGHRGYRFKEMITSQADSLERLLWSMDAGGLYWDPKAGRYVESFTGDTQTVVTTPHVVGITRELEFGRPGSWVGSLFEYEPPRMRFSASEQRLLRHVIADRTHTNETLAKQFGISLSTVKKIWQSIYDRVNEYAPEVLSERPRDTIREKRGKDKVRLLLQYLEEHPSELRPTLRRRPS